MDIRVTNGNGLVAIHLEGRFDFGARRAFAAARDKALAEGQRHIQVKFTGVDYVDSAALGMLLILREKAHWSGKSVSLADCRDNVRQMIEVAKFDRLFNISPA